MLLKVGAGARVGALYSNLTPAVHSLHNVTVTEDSVQKAATLLEKSVLNLKLSMQNVFQMAAAPSVGAPKSHWMERRTGGLVEPWSLTLCSLVGGWLGDTTHVPASEGKCCCDSSVWPGAQR